MSGSNVPASQAAGAAAAPSGAGPVSNLQDASAACTSSLSSSATLAPSPAPAPASASALQTSGASSSALAHQQRGQQPNQVRPQRQSSIPVAPNTLLSTVNASRQRQPMCAECEKSLPNQIVFDKIESIIRMMQDEHTGLPVKTAKSFMTKIPSVFTGIDLIQWMMKNLKLEDQQEAIHLANLIASHGYIFPIEDHTLSIKNDCTFYRFQTPCLWPSNNIDPENTDYAVYLCKRTMQGKTRLELADYEAENLARLQKMFSRKWEFIFMQAESQAKVDKKRDKLERKVLDSQERAFWDVYRPVPGCVNTTELDIKKACRLSKSAKRCGECQKIVAPQTQQQTPQQQQSSAGASIAPPASRSQLQQATSAQPKDKPAPVSSSASLAAPSSNTCSNKQQQPRHIAPVASLSPSPEVAQTAARVRESSTDVGDAEESPNEGGTCPAPAPTKSENEQSSAKSSGSSGGPVDTAAATTTSSVGPLTGETNLQCSAGQAPGSGRHKPHAAELETMSESAEMEQQQSEKQSESDPQEAGGSDGDAGSQQKATAKQAAAKQQEQQPPHTHHHHHHHHHPHAHSHPHPNHHHHHHHHHHPHSHSHQHAHHPHHHHHHHRQCPHYHKQLQLQLQQQLANKTGSGKQQQQDQTLLAGSSHAPARGETATAAAPSKCPNHNRCSLRSKQRPSSSVDQLAGPATSAGCRRKSECNRMLSMSEVTEDAEARAKATRATKQSSKLKSIESESGPIESAGKQQDSSGTTLPSVASTSGAGERPSSACCSPASMNANKQVASAPSTAAGDQAAPQSQLQPPQADTPETPATVQVNPVAGGQTRLQRKSSLNIGRPASVDQALPATAPAIFRGPGDGHPSFVRKGSVSSPTEHQRAQLKGAQSICAPNLAHHHQLHQLAGSASAGGGGGGAGGVRSAAAVKATPTTTGGGGAAPIGVKGHMGDLERELESLRVRLDRGGVKMSKVTQSYLSYFNQWAEYDPFIAQPIPSNPWQSDSTELWDSERQTKDVHFRRVRRWAFSLKELLNDPAGREQFHRFLEKEFSAENLKFWDAVQELKRVHAKDVARRIEAIWTEYLAQDANCPINIDSKSYETSKKNMAKNKNNRYIFDEAAGHVYQLMKNDSYPRYLRSDMYKDYKEASERRRPNQVAFDVFKPQITTLKHKFNF